MGFPQASRADMEALVLDVGHDGECTLELYVLLLCCILLLLMLTAECQERRLQQSHQTHTLERRPHAGMWLLFLSHSTQLRAT
jgi:hypothetical protein